MVEAPSAEVVSEKDRFSAGYAEAFGRLSTLLRSGDNARQIAAAKEIESYGRDAKRLTPELCAALVDRNENVRQAASEALEKVNPEFREIVLPIVVDQVARIRIDSLKKLCAMGNEGLPALPVVFARLTEIGKESVEKKRRISHYESEILACLETVFTVGRDQKAAFEACLLAASEGVTREVRALGIAHLPEMRSNDPKRSISVLITALKKDERLNRIIAIDSLGKYGRNAETAIELLRKMKLDSDAGIRSAAERAVKSIEDDIEKAK